jgi:hypothetical protein
MGWNAEYFLPNNGERLAKAPFQPIAYPNINNLGIMAEKRSASNMSEYLRTVDIVLYVKMLSF